MITAAAQTPVQICHEFHVGAISQEAAVTRIGEILPVLPGKNIISALEAFARRLTGRTDLVVKPINKADNWSGDNVFKVKVSGRKTAALFFKTFSINSKNFLPELFGLNYLNEEVPVISAPEIKAMGKFEENDTLFYIIAETPVIGKSFQKLYEEVSSAPMRAKAFATLQDAVRACAKGIAALHANKGEVQEPPAYLMSLLRDDFAKVATKLPSDFPFDKLNKYMVRTIETLPKEFIPSVTHGDVKLIHAFYDPATHLFGLVDGATLTRSVSKDNQPIGAHLKDYFRFIYSLKLNRFGYFMEEEKVVKKELLREDEVDTLIKNFRAAYSQAGGYPCSQEEEAFYTLDYEMHFVASFYNFEGDLPEPAIVRLRELALISAENLKSKCLGVE